MVCKINAQYARGGHEYVSRSVTTEDERERYERGREGRFKLMRHQAVTTSLGV